MTELIPVLELEPATYETCDRPRPAGSSTEDPTGWHEVWRAALADSGITDLTPWQPGSWFVPLSQFSASATLRTVMRHAFADLAEWDIDHIGPLSGGYVLSHEGSAIESGCCGDLSDLAEWIRAATWTQGAWNQVWIGHPWTYVRAAGDTLHFAEPCEAAEPLNAKGELAVPRVALAAAIEIAQRELTRFRAELAVIVTEHQPTIPVDAIVDILVHGH